VSDDNRSTPAPMLPESAANAGAGQLTEDDSGRSKLGPHSILPAVADADRSQILPVVRRRAEHVGQAPKPATPGEEKRERPHLGRRVVRGLRQIVSRDYGAQACSGSEMASALDYLRALIAWHEETKGHHHQ
jgi:hypothetical protein